MMPALIFAGGPCSIAYEKQGRKKYYMHGASYSDYDNNAGCPEGHCY